MQDVAKLSQAEADLYTRYKELQAESEFLKIQEDYIKDESKNLKREEIRAKEEVKRIQSVPLVIGEHSHGLAVLCSGCACVFHVRSRLTQIM